MKATLLLQRDHEELLSLFARYKGDGQDEAAQFVRIRQEIEVHSRVEDQLLSELQSNASPAATELANRAATQLHAVGVLLEEMKQLPPDSPQFAPKMHLLMGEVDEHIRFVENQIFEEVRQTLSQYRIEELGLEMEQHRLFMKAA